MKFAGIAVALSMSAVAAVGLMSAPAHAQAAGCEDRKVSVYFQANEANLDTFSDAVVARLANEAKSCSSARVIAETPAGALSEERVSALRSAFLDRGVRLSMQPASPYAAQTSDQAIMDRAVHVRISLATVPLG
jgi:hypothetical protein